MKTSEEAIKEVCEDIKELLLQKNRRYGDSALDPVRIFSEADSKEQIRVRIDDKLSRIASNQGDEDEDVIDDLIGYLILLKVADIVQVQEKKTYSLSDISFGGSGTFNSNSTVVYPQEEGRQAEEGSQAVPKIGDYIRRSDWTDDIYYKLIYITGNNEYILRPRHPYHDNNTQTWAYPIGEDKWEIRPPQ